MAERKKIVIVGAGFGGLQLARDLSSVEADVTVIDKENHHVFQPLLYQVATAGLSPSEIAVPIRHVLSESANTSVVLDEVERVDTSSKKLYAKNGVYAYDYLVLATGAVYNFFGHDEWSEHALSLKTIADALEIRKQILLAFERAEREPDAEKRRALLNFVVVGGGPTGVEMAGAIAELSKRALASEFRRIDPTESRILLLEGADRILLGFPEKLSRQAASGLSGLGVEVRTGAQVEKILPDGVVVNGDTVASQCVLWSAGVKASALIEGSGFPADRAGRIKVEQDLSVPGHPEVFVIGDAACVLGSDEKPLPGVAPVAKQQGHFLAKVLEDRLQGHRGEWKFRYTDKGNLATIGRTCAVADVARFQLSGFFAWIVWLVVHIVYLIGFRNRILVLIQWAWSYITFQRGSRLIVRNRFEEATGPSSVAEDQS